MPFAVLRVTANAFITARVCGKEAENVLLAVLHFTANALTACVCGRESANVPFAVLHFTANALTARVCGKSGKSTVCGLRVTANIFYYRMRLRQRRGKRAVCGFACYGECIYYRTRLRQKRQKYRFWHYIALYAYVEPYLTMGCTAPHFPRPTN